MHTPLDSSLSSSLHGGLLLPPIFGGIPTENLKLWTRFNQGITVTGSGVSQWDDQSGNGNHLKQAVDTNRPSKESDGSVLFDGVDNFLKTDAFTLNQPETIYLLVNQVTWTVSDSFIDGNTLNTGIIQAHTITPEVRLFAGSPTSRIAIPLGVFNVVTAIFNGASSVLQLNNDTPLIDNAGTSNMGGFNLGGSANIQVKECCVFNVAHDAAQRVQIINYLAKVGGLSI
ncbi:MAG: hypothetical protein KAR06_03740 [Deltaproteobacteria bacterium]|nr:hypothetical protein [Deltaproteobacteria bacterium]